MRLIDWIASDAIDQCRASDYTNTPCVCIFVCGVDAFFDRCAADLPKWGFGMNLGGFVGKIESSNTWTLSMDVLENARLQHVCNSFTVWYRHLLLIVLQLFVWLDWGGIFGTLRIILGMQKWSRPQRNIDVFFIEAKLATDAALYHNFKAHSQRKQLFTSTQ